MKTILAFIILALIILIPQLIKKRVNFSFDGEFNMNVISFIVGVVLVLSLLTLPIIRAGFKTEIKRYDAFKETINNARLDNISEIERASILQQISKWNMDIESAKYWNNTIFDLYIPDEVTELEHLE